MKRLHGFLCLLGVVSLGLASCGEDEKDPLRDRDGFCNEWAVEACNTTIVETCSKSKDDCRTAQAEFCRGLVKSDTYSRTAAKDCIKAVGKAYVDGKLDAQERKVVGVLGYLGGECEGVISGDGDEGASCTATSDCDTSAGLQCVIQLGETSGKCHVPEIVERGDECGKAQQVCVDGYYCGEGGNCIVQRGADRECSETEPCQDDFKCVISADETDDDEPADGDAGAPAQAPSQAQGGQCVAKAERTEACEEDADCKTGICHVQGNKTCVNDLRVDNDATDLCKGFR